VKRLTYKKGGRWVYVHSHYPKRDERRVGANPLYLYFRLLDRLIIGEDNGRNHW
jgi:hypothetical protein